MSNNQNGFSIEEYIKSIEENLERFEKELGRLNTADKKIYESLLDEFKRINSSAEGTKIKGNILENIVTFIIQKSGFLKVYRNVKTSSNEIDQLILLNVLGRVLMSKNIIDLPDNQILGECKNYNKTIGVTWVGKLYSLSKVTNNRLSILFSYHGLTGNGWNDAIGLTKKIYMLESDKDKKSYILDFSIADFEKINKGVTFWEIINQKIVSLRNDTNISAYLSESHPLELDSSKIQTLTC